MFSNYVNTSFDLAQGALATYKSNFIGSKKSENAKIELTARFKAIPFALADGALESLRSIALVVESAGLLVLSILAVPFAVVYGHSVKDFNLAKQMMRSTLINLNNTVYSAVHRTLKIALMPLTILAQMTLLAMNPYEPNSSSTTFKNDRDTSIKKDIKEMQEFCFTSLSKQIEDHSVVTVKEEANRNTTQSKSGPSLKTRAKLFGLAVADTGLNILTPTFLALVAVVDVIVTLFKVIPIAAWKSYQGRPDANVKEHFVAVFKSLNTIIESVAEAAAKTAAAPLALIGQSFITQMNPEKMLPSQDALYASKIGDYRMTRDGVQKRVSKLYDEGTKGEENDWAPLFEKREEEQEMQESTQNFYSSGGSLFDSDSSNSTLSSLNSTSSKKND